MLKPPTELRWVPEAIANVMARNGIRNRNDLANHLDSSRSVIYQQFDSNWSGTATVSLLAQLAWHFGVPLGSLVVEPAALRGKGSPDGRKRQYPANRKRFTADASTNIHVTRR